MLRHAVMDQRSKLVLIVTATWHLFILTICSALDMDLLQLKLLEQMSAKCHSSPADFPDGFCQNVFQEECVIENFLEEKGIIPKKNVQLKETVEAVNSEWAQELGIEIFNVSKTETDLFQTPHHKDSKETIDDIKELLEVIGTKSEEIIGSSHDNQTTSSAKPVKVVPAYDVIKKDLFHILHSFRFVISDEFKHLSENVLAITEKGVERIFDRLHAHDMKELTHILVMHFHPSDGASYHFTVPSSDHFTINIPEINNHSERHVVLKEAFAEIRNSLLFSKFFSNLNRYAMKFINGSIEKVQSSYNHIFIDFIAHWLHNNISLFGKTFPLEKLIYDEFKNFEDIQLLDSFQDLCDFVKGIEERREFKGDLLQEVHIKNYWEDMSFESLCREEMLGFHDLTFWKKKFLRMNVYLTVYEIDELIKVLEAAKEDKIKVSESVKNETMDEIEIMLKTDALAGNVLINETEVKNKAEEEHYELKKKTKDVVRDEIERESVAIEENLELESESNMVKDCAKEENFLEKENHDTDDLDQKEKNTTELNVKVTTTEDLAHPTGEYDNSLIFVILWFLVVLAFLFIVIVSLMPIFMAEEERFSGYICYFVIVFVSLLYAAVLYRYVINI